MPEPPRLRVLEEQEQILSQAGSGYGREQVVRLALRLACRDVSELSARLARLEPDGQHDTRREDALMIEFLQHSERILRGDPDA